ncbi:ABC transporter substrate-binding protein [Streptomyces plumbiresistens]|uniref:Solute-binding protein family 5 domain-containing protein n=1 Tax=Streptomyces plumbiresistens TaxID=511811 RepID=A0ABP7SKU7_9ACTN
MSLVTEPLERVSSTGTFTPNLATSVTQPNTTTLVYKLRPGVKFSNGREMTAQDVAWSIEHFTADTAQTAALGQQVGSASVTGPLEVTVRLKAPAPTARAGIALATLVEDAEFAKAHAKSLGNAGTAPIGTGPYQVASQTSEKITLVRNPQYTRTRPAADKVVFSVIPDDTSRQLALRSGSIDGGPVTNRKSVAQWKAIPGATVYAAPSLSQNFLAMDVTRAPFDDVHVRRAVAHSVDIAGIRKAGFNAYARPMTGLVPAGELAGVAGSQQAAEAFLADLPQHELSEAKAKAELAKSAHPQGFSTTIEYVKDYPWQELTVLNIQRNMQPLGVKITPKPVTANEWYAKFYKHELTGITLPFASERATRTLPPCWANSSARPTSALRRSTSPTGPPPRSTRPSRSSPPRAPRPTAGPPPGRSSPRSPTRSPTSRSSSRTRSTPSVRASPSRSRASRPSICPTAVGSSR